jgi:hypothetical protein
MWLYAGTASGYEVYLSISYLKKDGMDIHAVFSSEGVCLLGRMVIESTSM